MSAHIPRKRFGQNFLHDTSVLHHIIDAIDPKKDDHMVEIGPGQGALTELLLNETDKLDVVELDRDLIPQLKEMFKGKDTLHIHSGDALRFDFCALAVLNKKLRIVGNLPYNISTPLMFHLLEQTSCIEDMHFMLQKEVADRLAAQPSTSAYGRLSLMIQYRCSVERLFIVPPTSFKPIPKVDSAFVRLVPHRQAPVKVTDEDTLRKVITQAFSQRRKTLRNTLKKLLSVEEITALGIDPGLRAEALTLEQYADLSNTVSARK